MRLLISSVVISCPSWTCQNPPLIGGSGPRGVLYVPHKFIIGIDSDVKTKGCSYSFPRKVDEHQLGEDLFFKTSKLRKSLICYF